MQGVDGGRYSYLELVEFLEAWGARPHADLPELWLRALFSCAIGNTDNHLRNYGFLCEGTGWALSPAFDVNPTPGDEPKYLNTGLDFDVREADPRVALSACEYFRLGAPEAKRRALAMAGVLKGWRSVARSCGISEASIERMRSSFEAGIARLRSAAR